MQIEYYSNIAIEIFPNILWLPFLKNKFSQNLFSPGRIENSIPLLYKYVLLSQTWGQKENSKMVRFINSIQLFRKRNISNSTHFINLHINVQQLRN